MKQISAILALAALLQAAAPGGRAASEENPAASSALRQEVRAYLEQRVASDPQDVIALNRLAGEYLRALRSTGDISYVERASDAARKSLKAVAPEFNNNGLIAMGRSLLEEHRFSDCRDTALGIIKRHPTALIGYQLLGDSLYELGDYSGARDAFAKMKELDDGIPAESRLSRMAYFDGEPAKARELLEHCVQLAMAADPIDQENLAWIEMKLGELDFQTGDLSRADAEYNKALSDAPGNWSITEHIAELRGAQERWNEAADLFREVIAKTHRPDIEQALGDLYNAWGKQTEAAAHWKNAQTGYEAQTQPDASLLWLHHLAAFTPIAWKIHRKPCNMQPPTCNNARALRRGIP